MMRLTKTNGAILDCDTQACFDRIVLGLQSIFSRRLGIPRTATIFLRDYGYSVSTSSGHDTAVVQNHIQAHF